MDKEILEVLRDSLIMLANNGGLGKTELMERIAGLIEKGSSQQGVMVPELIEALRHIARVGCMNRPGDEIWCNDGVHSIYCPAGIAIAALAAAPSAQEVSRDRDWILAIAAALGMDSGYSVPIVPEIEPFKQLFTAIRAGVSPSAEGVIEPVREQCPDCPDGQVWDNKGPTGETCLTCGGEAFVWKSRSLKSKEGGAG